MKARKFIVLKDILIFINQKSEKEKNDMIVFDSDEISSLKKISQIGELEDSLNK